ncbi:MAG: DUF6807 domain-containing protein [Planctomycetota bacterium]|jgi:hypothetical protein
MKHTIKVTIGIVMLMGIATWLTGCNQTHFGQTKETKSGYGWRHNDSSLALVKNDKVVWQLNYDKKEGKPYFHPLSLTDGTELTWLRPSDHPWHRALWFSWKYINGLNYWEEDATTGRSEGITELFEIKAFANQDYSAQFEIKLNYHPPEKPTVLTEKRMMIVHRPDENGCYRIDWQSIFTAGSEDVILDRTPIPGEEDGKSWGGYAGLSARLAENASEWQVIDSQGRKDLQANKKHARWLDFSFKTVDGNIGGIAMFDHPLNPRHPSPWYVIMAEPMRYFTPAFLYYNPYTLPAGKSLTLQYRILIHPGRPKPELMEKEWNIFKRKTGKWLKTN